MQISVGTNEKDLSLFESVELDTFEAFCQTILKKNWAPGLFLNNHRTKANFLGAECLALDVDEGLPLEMAKDLFASHQHVIATTKSHQIEKNGKIADRYRVILFLHKIANTGEFEATVRNLMASYPFVDLQCKDASRFFYPCKEIVSVKTDGLEVQVLEPQDSPLKAARASQLSAEEKGRLSRSTLEFLVNGANPGFWNASLFKAALDYNEQGYSEDQFLDAAEKVTGVLDPQDLKTIKSAFERIPKYEPRFPTELISQNEIQTLLKGIDRPSLILKSSDFANASLSYLQNKELVMGEPTRLEGLDYLLGGGKRLGEITALTATAKAGKSALIHFLIHKWVKAGIAVGFASREMSPETEVTPNLLSLSFKENAWKAGIDEEKAKNYVEEMTGWPLYYTRGFGFLGFDELKEWMLELKNGYGVNYFVLDHLLYTMANPEDFKEVSLFMRNLKAFVNEQKIHLDLIIQPKQIGLGERIGANSLRGGANISQAINTLLTLERVPEQKNISKLTLEIGRSRLCRQGSIFLQYDQETTEFSEVIPEVPEITEIPQDAPKMKLHAID